MTIRAATPYLILSGGRGRQAIAHYDKALGARVEDLKRYGDVDGSCDAAQRELVMHAALRVGDAQIMLSDDPTGQQGGPRGPVQVVLTITDVAEARRAFDALSEGGRVVQPLFEAPWGALFGALQDPFGVSWMFNCPLE